MTILDCEQGSREWVEARLGIPTASQFSRLLTPKRMQVSAGRHRYRAELLAEWITGEPVEEFDTEWTERGRLLEPQARQHYGIVHDVEPRQVGLCLRPVPSAPHLSVGVESVGASPDALVGSAGALELKCPGMVNHILYCADGGLPASPHTRGWTGRVARNRPEVWGFPAHAGMDPVRVPRERRGEGLPRTRGDGPWAAEPATDANKASPHTRGWTRGEQGQRDGREGFPAHAGMDPGEPLACR